MASYENLKTIDFTHLWHPFTKASLWFEQEPLVIERAQGFELIDTKGESYLDGVSSLWCNVHGHNVPELISTLKNQAEKLCHATLLGTTHVPILELTEELLNHAPSHFSRVFYSDSGTAAVEAALRMALEWQQHQGTGRTKLASLVGAYHGDTLGSIGVGFIPDFHSALSPVVTPALRVRPPHVFQTIEGYSDEQALEASIAEVQKLFEDKGEELAAFIVEPLVQGAAGMWIHTSEYLQKIEELCRKHEVLLIADEVATGFGKTGEMFAVEKAGVKPDLLVLGKGLTGGYLPMSAVLATEAMFDGFRSSAFFFGQTFSGNPLAAAVALASLRLFKANNLISQIKNHIPVYQDLLETHISPLAKVRSCGFMTGIEVSDAQAVVKKAREENVIIRPLDNVIVLMPAVAMDEANLERLVTVTADAIKGV